MAKNRFVVALDEPRFSYWSALYKCLYSSSLYVDVGKRWPGFGLRYLLFIVALFTIPIGFYYGAKINHFVEYKVLGPLTAMPIINAKYGTYSIDKPEPYLIRYKDTGKVAIVINTASSEVSSYFKQYPDLMGVVSRYELLLTARNMNLDLGFSPVDFKAVKDVTVQPLPKQVEHFDAQQVFGSRGITLLKWVLVYLPYPLLASIIIGFEVVFLLMAAFLGQVIASTIFKISINYKQTCRLMMVASTPMLALSYVIFALGVKSFLMSILCLVVLISWFSFGVLSYKKYTKQLVHA